MLMSPYTRVKRLTRYHLLIHARHVASSCTLPLRVCGFGGLRVAACFSRVEEEKKSQQLMRGCAAWCAGWLCCAWRDEQEMEDKTPEMVERYSEAFWRLGPSRCMSVCLSLVLLRVREASERFAKMQAGRAQVIRVQGQEEQDRQQYEDKQQCARRR